MKIRRFLRGDTIVEVLLAMAITSAVLAGAYVATNRSLKAGKDAQERSEALEIAEGQHERIKALSNSGTPSVNIFDPAVPYFCLDSSLTTARAVAVASGPGPSGETLFTFTFPPECQTGFYYYFVERVSGINPGQTVFISRVVWPSITGASSANVTVGGVTGTAEGYAIVSLIYRVYR